MVRELGATPQARRASEGQHPLAKRPFPASALWALLRSQRLCGNPQIRPLARELDEPAVIRVLADSSAGEAREAAGSDLDAGTRKNGSSKAIHLIIESLAIRCWREGRGTFHGMRFQSFGGSGTPIRLPRVVRRVVTAALHPPERRTATPRMRHRSQATEILVPNWQSCNCQETHSAEPQGGRG